MKIIYLGKFNLSYSTENYVTHALEQAGVEVKKLSVSRSSFSGFKWHERKFRPNLVLFSKSERPYLDRIVQFCRDQRLLTVTWFWDLYWGLRSRRSLPPQFRANLVFTTDGGHNGAWEERGIKHGILRQGIHVPENLIVEQGEKFDYDVAFVGWSGASSRRRELLSFLEKTYKGRFRHYVQSRGMQLNYELSRVKVVVGDSRGVDNYWSNRIYEITGRGGFMLHPQIVGLDEEFEDSVHYATYERDNFDDMKKQIDRWVEDDEGRERIRLAGFEHCGNHYTYNHRVATLIKKIQEFPLL